MLAGRRQNDDFSGGDQSEEINLVEYGDVEDKKMILVTVRRQRRGSCDTDTGRAIPGERYRASDTVLETKVCMYISKSDFRASRCRYVEHRYRAYLGITDTDTAV
jgi:hypothetical protein